MRRFAPTLLGLLLLTPAPAPAQTAPDLQATYEMYADGLHVAQVTATFRLGATSYAIQLAYHTTGLVSLFRHGHQMNRVVGVWDRGQPAPEQFSANGIWGGQDNATLIDYVHHQPVIESLVTPPQDKREPVPETLQENSIDSLSALALLIRRVQQTGSCEASVRTYDGRRASVISASTGGEEILGPSGLSMFSGKALRCNFVGQMVAGFLYRDKDHTPLHGSAWLATLAPGDPPLPVRMDFQTRWFGEAHMYLRQLASAPPTEVAAH